MTALIEITYFLAIFSFLIGLKFLSNPRRAKLGNSIAGGGMVAALAISIIAHQSSHLSGVNYLIITSMLLLGTLIGKTLSKKVNMTGMPQLVSFFNATGGACALLLGVSEANLIQHFTGLERLTLQLGASTGAMATSGSIVALLKLSGRMKDRKSQIQTVCSLVFLLAMVIMLALSAFQFAGFSFLNSTLTVVGIALLYGVMFVLPIGGADMPVVISLLNAITGIATAFAGVLYSNKVMLAGGIIVGSAGLLLTIMMCRAMNRSLLKVLTGSFNKPKAASQTGSKTQNIVTTTISETALQLSLAKKVAVIPGYGLAVAQAQHLCKQLENTLHNLQVDVHYIIHPVAGRMPGHMNVLLAEAAIEYHSLKEIDEVNDNMNTYDMALIVGANDVVNPAAENNSESPIYGMPIIKAYQCASSVVLKRSMNVGYAGISNELFDSKGCKLLFGDASDSLQQIIHELKQI